MSSKPLPGDLRSHPGSVPPGTAMESSEQPGIPLERRSGSGEPSLGSKRCGSVRGPSVLPSRPRSAEGSLLPRASVQPSPSWSACVGHPEHRSLADSHVGNDVQATPFLGWNFLAGSLGWKHPGEVAADKSCVSEPKDWRVEGGCSAFAAGCFSLCGTLQEKRLWEPPVKPRQCPCSLAAPGN